MLVGEKFNACLLISILLIKLAFATVNIWMLTCSAQGMSPHRINFIYILLSLSLSLSLLRCKKLPSSLYSVSPGLCQQDCLYFPPNHLVTWWKHIILCNLPGLFWMKVKGNPKHSESAKVTNSCRCTTLFHRHVFCCFNSQHYNLCVCVSYHRPGGCLACWGEER